MNLSGPQLQSIIRGATKTGQLSHFQLALALNISVVDVQQIEEGDYLVWERQSTPERSERFHTWLLMEATKVEQNMQRGQAEGAVYRRFAHLMESHSDDMTIGNLIQNGLVSEDQIDWALEPLGDPEGARQQFGLPPRTMQA
jgi:hypothetical protein